MNQTILKSIILLFVSINCCSQKPFDSKLAIKTINDRFHFEKETKFIYTPKSCWNDFYDIYSNTSDIEKYFTPKCRIIGLDYLSIFQNEVEGIDKYLERLSEKRIIALETARPKSNYVMGHDILLSRVFTKKEYFTIAILSMELIKGCTAIVWAATYDSIGNLMNIVPVSVAGGSSNPGFWSKSIGQSLIGDDVIFNFTKTQTERKIRKPNGFERLSDETIIFIKYQYDSKGNVEKVELGDEFSDVFKNRSGKLKTIKERLQFLFLYAKAFNPDYSNSKTISTQLISDTEINVRYKSEVVHYKMNNEIKNMELLSLLENSEIARLKIKSKKLNALGINYSIIIKLRSKITFEKIKNAL